MNFLLILKDEENSIFGEDIAQQFKEKHHRFSDANVLVRRLESLETFDSSVRLGSVEFSEIINGFHDSLKEDGNFTILIETNRFLVVQKSTEIYTSTVLFYGSDYRYPPEVTGYLIYDPAMYLKMEGGFDKIEASIKKHTEVDLKNITGIQIPSLDSLLSLDLNQIKDFLINNACNKAKVPYEESHRVNVYLATSEDDYIVVQEKNNVKSN